jgi:hypothetical protein
MIKLLCLEKINGNVKILEMIERLNDQDIKTQEKLKFQMQQKQWKEAA